MWPLLPHHSADTFAIRSILVTVCASFTCSLRTSCLEFLKIKASLFTSLCSNEANRSWQQFFYVMHSIIESRGVLMICLHPSQLLLPTWLKKEDKIRAIRKHFWVNDMLKNSEKKKGFRSAFWYILDLIKINLRSRVLNYKSLIWRDISVVKRAFYSCKRQEFCCQYLLSSSWLSVSAAPGNPSSGLCRNLYTNVHIHAATYK